MISSGTPAQTTNASQLTVIDTHTHFYDPSRPQGVPWPNKNDERLYRTVLPKDYRAQPLPQTIASAVAVEASPWVEDNQWLLELAASDTLIVGLVGNLPMGTPEFAVHLKRFAASSLFRGIRIKHTRLHTGLNQFAFLSDVRLLADYELVLDVYGGPTMLPEVAKLAELFPHLRIVVNHIANVKIDGQVGMSRSMLK